MALPKNAAEAAKRWTFERPTCAPPDKHQPKVITTSANAAPPAPRETALRESRAERMARLRRMARQAAYESLEAKKPPRNTAAANRRWFEDVGNNVMTAPTDFSEWMMTAEASAAAAGTATGTDLVDRLELAFDAGRAAAAAVAHAAASSDGVFESSRHGRANLREVRR